MVAMVFPTSPNDGDQVAQPNGNTYTWNAAKNRWEVLSSGGGGASNLFSIVDQKAPGTDGGTFTLGAWRTRDLNTIIVNEIAGASLSANQVTLPAGTYRVYARAPAASAGRILSRLYDVTGAAELLKGSNTRTATSGTEMVDSIIVGQFVLGVTSVIELQHQSNATQTDTGFGAASNIGGEGEVYSAIEFLKVA